MTNREVKELSVRVPNLIEYLAKEKVKNFKLYYGLNENLDRIDRESEKFDKSVKTQLPELFEIEQKAAELGKVENEKIEKENAELAEKEKDQEKKTEPKKLLTLVDALKLLPKEEQDKHSEMMKEYEKILDQESDLQLYKLKKEDIGNIEIEFWAARLLARFIDE